MQRRQNNILTITSLLPVRCLSPVVICSGAALRGYASLPLRFFWFFYPRIFVSGSLLSPGDRSAIQQQQQQLLDETSVSVMRWSAVRR